MNDSKQFNGIYRATVRDNKDPENLRRLRLQVQTTGTEVTGWVWPSEPSSVHTAPPVIGQGVWVAYIGGDPDYPVWVGVFGKNQGDNKQVYVKPLDNSVPLTGLTPYLEITQRPDGTEEVDLTATLLLMAATLLNYETRLASLESQITQKASTSHSHPGL